MVHAQQIIPIEESQRQYITFHDAAPKIFAAAVARSKPPTTDSDLDVAGSFKRLLEFAKYSSNKTNLAHTPDGFSYLTFLPGLIGGAINGETLSYNFAYDGTVSAVAARTPGAFIYKMKQNYSSESVSSGVHPLVLIYKPDLAYTFSTVPELIGSTLNNKKLCTSSSAACSIFLPYTIGRYKWFYRASSYMIACNDVSDCVQANVSNYFYGNTYRLTQFNYTPPFYGEYVLKPVGNCLDSKEYAYLKTLISGLSCLYSLQYNVILSQYSGQFVVSGSSENTSLEYISLSPIPISCPGASKYYQLLSCDPRFLTDVIAPASLALLVDKMFSWASQRFGYRGIQYTPVTVSDVISAIGNNLVKVSSLAQTIPEPELGLVPGGFVGDEITSSLPQTAYSQNTGTDVTASSVSIDLGSNPNTPSPEMESEPNPSNLIDAIFTIFPSFRAYHLGSYSIEYPSFSFNIFNSFIYTDGHCKTIETQRHTISAISLLAWSYMVFVIVVRA